MEIPTINPDFPVFLLPYNEFMWTAKIEDNNLLLIEKTTFPTRKKYSISRDGIAVCLDIDKNNVLWGKLSTNGSCGVTSKINIDNSQFPLSMNVIHDKILIGGSVKSNLEENLNLDCFLSVNDLDINYSSPIRHNNPTDIPYSIPEIIVEDEDENEQIILVVEYLNNRMLKFFANPYTNSSNIIYTPFDQMHIIRLWQNEILLKIARNRYYLATFSIDFRDRPESNKPLCIENVYELYKTHNEHLHYYYKICVFGRPKYEMILYVDIEHVKSTLSALNQTGTTS